jgi:mRNA-degrading endonuclease toxin of MazEF toxin-antitoxin module
MYGLHRCVILQSKDVTAELDFTLVIPISSARYKPEKTSWVEIPKNTIAGTPARSYLICEQIRAIDKRRIGKYVGKLSSAYLIEAQKILEFLCPSVLDQIPDPPDS